MSLHQRMSKRRATQVAALLLAFCGSLPLAHGAYLQAKASVAQVLLMRAWQRSVDTGATVRPWSWADTAPVAKLRVDRLAIEQIVLSGDSGRTLAFGPGWTESSARPGNPGLSIISAHRDTHFAFLRDVQIGERVELQTVHGLREYQVSAMRIVDARHERIDTSLDQDRLLLVTCYPFDALSPGGPLRYVVTASRVDPTT